MVLHLNVGEYVAAFFLEVLYSNVKDFLFLNCLGFDHRLKGFARIFFKYTILRYTVKFG